jgi:TonB family protein
LGAALLGAAAVALTACASSEAPPSRSAGEYTAPVLISGAVPEYTQEALDARVGGRVSARCRITKTGRVTGCQTVESIPLMDKAVLDALATWRCKPALRGETPVEVDHVFTLRLKLPPEAGGESTGSPNATPFDGKTMTRPQLVIGKDPIYTREALAKRAQGLFRARCVITTEGEVKNCVVLQSIPLMDDAILDALTQRRYTPVSHQGQLVDVTYVFNVKLVLPGR